MYKKTLYHSEVFGAPVWIVNVSVAQALTDPEIIASGHAVFSQKEITVMKTIPLEDRPTSYRAIYATKHCFPGAVVQCVQPYEPMSMTSTFVPEPVEPPVVTVPEKRRRRRALTLAEGDAIGQGRLVGLS